jgi:hypothetical protein
LKSDLLNVLPKLLDAKVLSWFNGILMV